jgi:nucleotide-binding universal stress UspA family protein
VAAPVFTRVLVGWDGSQAAAAGLRAGCTLTAFPSGTVTALSVVPTFSHVETDVERQLAARDARESLEAEYKRVLATIALHPEQRVCLRFIEDARVADALDTYVTQQTIDLLIVGLHGREGVLHPKMGHIANHVVKSGRCPVLVVPEPHGHDVVSLAEPPNPMSALRGLFHPTRHHPAAV